MHKGLKNILKLVLMLLCLVLISITLNNSYAYFTNGYEITESVTDVNVKYKENITFDTVKDSQDSLTIYFDNSSKLWQAQCISYGTKTDSNINNSNGFTGWPGVRMMYDKPKNSNGTLRDGLWVSYTITGEELKKIRSNNGGYFKINDTKESQYPEGSSNWFKINGNDTEIYVTKNGELTGVLTDNVIDNYEGVKIYYRSITDTNFYIWNENGNLSSWPGTKGEKVTIDGIVYSMIEIKDKWYNTTLIDDTYYCALVFYFPDTKSKSFNISLPKNAKEVFYTGNSGKYELDSNLTTYYVKEES